MKAALLAIAIVFGLVAPVRAETAADGSAAAVDGERVSRSAAGFSSERSRPGPRDPTELEETRLAAEAATDATAPPRERAALQSCCAFRIYDAFADLFYDFDGDGYYHYLRVTFDADTDYFDAYVYAELYLSRNGGPWIPYFTTDVFRLQGSSAYDDYEVETELVSGYPPGLYDVLIELYDADYDELVAEFGPYQSSALALLPLEDAERDLPPPPPGGISHGHGGGAVGWGWLLLVLAGRVARRLASLQG